MTTFVEADAVRKSFGSLVAVDGMDLVVRQGEVVGLLGANGAGKTTLIRCLLGLLRPDSGTVRVLGELPHREVLRQVGYMPQGLGLYDDLSVKENLEFRRRVYGTGADPNTLANGRPVRELGLGSQRRAAFAAAIAHRPRLLVLDEPTSGVGTLGRARLWEVIRDAVEEGAGALVTTHHLEEAEQCDRLVMMAGGKEVASGSLGDVIGGRTAVIVEVDQQREAFDALVAGGQPVILAGNHLRISSDDQQTINRILADAGLAARLRTVPATLEEAFVAMSR